jgi:mRNA interferase RelE/StbE
VPFSLLYHPDISDDLDSIPRNMQERIEAAIRTRLLQAPQAYGKPLAANLSGYWKMRVGDYRIIYKVAKGEIWILGIINRRDVYRDILKRLDWIST